MYINWSYVCNKGRWKTNQRNTTRLVWTAKSISVSKLWTTIVGGKGDYEAIDKQIDVLKVEIQNTDNLKECERIQERITRLASGVAVIRVGASTEIEMIEKKHRIEDALEAVRSAQQMGVITGGGSALAKIADQVQVMEYIEQSWV